MYFLPLRGADSRIGANRITTSAKVRDIGNHSSRRFFWFGRRGYGL
jgi:hypothetical protein